MSHGYLLGYEKKFARAQTHLEELKLLIRAWLDDNVDGWRAQVSAGQWGFAPRHLDIEAERDRWSDMSVVAGDVVHNMRSSLELLAGALVLANGGRPNDHTTFPVLKIRPTANRQGVHPLPNIAPVRPGVAQRARELLDQEQPYTFDEDWPSHPLWLLHAMWNQDKHRLLLATNPWLTRTYSVADGNAGFWQVAGELEPIERGDDYTRFRLIPDVGHADVKGETTLQIAIGPMQPGEGRSLFGTLKYLSDFVSDAILEPFRPYVLCP